MELTQIKRSHLKAHAHPTESSHRGLVTPTEPAFATAAIVPNFYSRPVLPRKYQTLVVITQRP